MNTVIRSDIPVPDHRPRVRWPFAEMKVGDSFHTPYTSARTSSLNYAKRHGVKFACRAEAGGIRIWRVA